MKNENKIYCAFIIDKNNEAVCKEPLRALGVKAPCSFSTFDWIHANNIYVIISARCACVCLPTHAAFPTNR